MASSGVSSSDLLQHQQDDDHLPPGTALIDARIIELQREQGYARFFSPQSSVDLQAQTTGGDTLVQMNFPNSSSIRCDGTTWTNIQLRMSADKILATKSAVFREKLAEVTPDMIRRRQERADPMIPEGIKYILDLTPPEMDQDSAALVSILSVPESVRAWWQSNERLGTPRICVLGHDDACPDHQYVPDDCSKFPGVALDIKYECSLPALDLDDIQPVKSRAIPDYCPIRHRANIINIMEAIMFGSSCLLTNSATRVFTLVKLAKVLDCLEVVRDHVYSWALTHTNDCFISLLPEVSLALFWDLRIPEIVRSTFSILVVEGALDLLGAPLSPNPDTQRIAPTTIFGRKRDLLPDDLANVIQPACDNLTERTRATLGYLESDSIYDLLVQGDMAGTNIPEWDHLSDIGETLGCPVPGRSTGTAVNPPVPVVTARSEDQQFCLQRLRNTYHDLASTLVAYFHHDVAESLSPIDCCFDDTDLDRKCYVPRSQFTRTSDIYERLSKEQRLLTRLPWENLMTKARLFLPASSNNLALLSTRFDEELSRSGLLFPELAPYSRYNRSGGGVSFFSLDAFCTEYTAAIELLYDRRALKIHEDNVYLRRSRHLALGLAEGELRYLPIWAGGNDDGSGGVHDPGFIPDSEHGPSGPGPAFHTGFSVATTASSIAPSTPTISGTTDDTAMNTEGRSLAAAASSSSNSSTANNSQCYPTRDASVLESQDFMTELDESDTFDFSDLRSDDFPLD